MLSRLGSLSLVRFVSDSLYDKRATNFWLKKTNPLLSTNQALAKIVARQQVSSDTVAFTLRCNYLMPFGAAGQHHPLRVEIAGRRYERHYSLTRIDRRHVQMIVKRVPEGKVSNWLHQQGHVGRVLQFGRPFGDVTLSNFKSKRLIFLAAGSGITPILSLLNAIDQADSWSNYTIELWYWAKSQHDFVYSDQLLQWQQRHPQFTLNLRCTQWSNSDQNDTNSSPFVPADRLNDNDVTHMQHIERSSVFACGPSGFTQRASQLLRHAQQLQVESFSLPLITNAVHSNQQVSLTLLRSNKTIQIAQGVPLLVALEQAQISPKSGCRMGICNTCVCQKISGTTHNLTDSSHNHEPQQALKICVNSAHSDLVLDL